MNVNEGEELVYVLPEFRDLLAKFDLSDNVFDENGIDLSLNDLSNNALWDLTNNNFAGSATDWKFFDDDYATLKGDKTTYQVKIDGEVIPRKDNWATFNKGTLTFKPLGKHIGDHLITISTTDLSGNVAEQGFYLTVNAVSTPYVRSKFKDNKFDFKTDYSMKDNELLTFTLPEFESADCLPARSSSAYHKEF